MTDQSVTAYDALLMDLDAIAYEKGKQDPEMTDCAEARAAKLILEMREDLRWLIAHWSKGVWTVPEVAHAGDLERKYG